MCASETLAYTHSFREYLETGAAGVVMVDLSWCGGLTEARKIAGMFHDNFAKYADGVSEAVRNAGPATIDADNSAEG